MNRQTLPSLMPLPSTLHTHPLVGKYPTSGGNSYVILVKSTCNTPEKKNLKVESESLSGRVALHLSHTDPGVDEIKLHPHILLVVVPYDVGLDAQ